MQLSANKCYLYRTKVIKPFVVELGVSVESDRTTSSWICGNGMRGSI